MAGTCSLTVKLLNHWGAGIPGVQHRRALFEMVLVSMYSYGCSVVSNTSSLNSAAYSPIGPFDTGTNAAPAGLMSATAVTEGDAISVRPSRRPVPKGSIAYSAGSTMVRSSAHATRSATAVVFASFRSVGVGAVCASVLVFISAP